jgi:hypothetical protein
MWMLALIVDRDEIIERMQAKLKELEQRRAPSPRRKRVR